MLLLPETIKINKQINDNEYAGGMKSTNDRCMWSKYSGEILGHVFLGSMFKLSFESLLLPDIL